MVLKLKSIKFLLHLRRENPYFLCGVSKFLSTSFCNIAEEPPTIESPELPNWVKFTENPKGDDDDFVIPAISYWIQNHKLQDPELGHKLIVNDLVNFDVDNIGKILRNQFQSPDDVFQALSGCSVVNLTESSIEQILKRFNNNWIPAFGFFNWAKLQLGFKHSPNCCNLMVDILGKSKKFKLVWKLLEEMNEMGGGGGGGGYITLVTMSKVMRRLSRSGRYTDAITAFERIEEFGVRKDIEAMNALIDALVKEHSVEHAQDVYMEFKNSIHPNARTFNILIHGWCNARKLDIARKTMEEMENHGFRPDVVSYTSFVEAYGRDKDFRKLDGILEEMQEKGCQPNAVTYTIVMHALGKAKEMKEALKVYEKMKQNGCIPDSSFYSSLIYILSQAGRLRDAHEVFDDMSNQGVSPDTLTYNTMIGIACKHSQEENALKLLHRMGESRCKPDLSTYHPLLKMCCRMKRIKLLFSLLSHMFKNDVSVELGTYTLLVQGLCKSGKFEYACFFFEETVLKGFVPKDSTYKMLMEELEKKQPGKAKNLIEELMLQAKKQSEV